MQEFHQLLSEKLTQLINVSTLLAKLMLGFGVLCLIFYFFKIEYFPTDISIGDSLVFFVISFSFGLIYFLSLVAHYAFGCLVFGIINIILISFPNSFQSNFLVRNYCYFRHEVNLDFFKSGVFYDLLYKLGKICVIIFLSFFIIFLYDFNYLSLFIAVSVSISTYFGIRLFYDEYTSKNEKAYTGAIILPNDELEKYRIISQRNKNNRMMGLLILGCIMPFWGYISDKENSKLLSFSVNSITVNKKKSFMLVKQEFKTLIPNEFIVKDESLKGYVRVKNIQVLLKGVGKNALLKFDFENGSTLRREIPNDAIFMDQIIIKSK